MGQKVRVIRSRARREREKRGGEGGRPRSRPVRASPLLSRRTAPTPYESEPPLPSRHRGARGRTHGPLVQPGRPRDCHLRRHHGVRVRVRAACRRVAGPIRRRLPRALAVRVCRWVLGGMVWDRPGVLGAVSRIVRVLARRQRGRGVGDPARARPPCRVDCPPAAGGASRPSRASGPLYTASNLNSGPQSSSRSSGFPRDAVAAIVGALSPRPVLGSRSALVRRRRAQVGRCVGGSHGQRFVRSGDGRRITRSPTCVR